MAGTITVDTIQSDTSYTSTINVASKINFSAGMQVGGQDATFGGIRNRLVNGAMTIDQRRAGAIAYGETDFNNKPNTCDMWYAALGNGGGGTTLQQVTDAPPGFTNSLKWTGRTSSVTLGVGNWDALLTSIEGLNIADLNWGTQYAQPITISFWVKGSVATTMSLAVYNGGASDNAPSSGNVTRCYVANYTINTINTWEYKTITIPGPTSGTWRTDNGIGLTLYFNLNSGSNYTGTVTNAWETVAGTAHVQTSATATNYMVLGGNKTFQLTGVQLEKGSSATAFEFRPYAHELRLCQRYLQDMLLPGRNFSVRMFASTYCRIDPMLETRMRTTPTVIKNNISLTLNTDGTPTGSSFYVYNGYTGSFLSGTFGNNGVDSLTPIGCSIYFNGGTVSVSNGYGAGTLFGPSAQLILGAEL